MGREAERNLRKEERRPDLNNEKLTENDVQMRNEKEKGSIVFHNNKIAAHFYPPPK